MKKLAFAFALILAGCASHTVAPVVTGAGSKVSTSPYTFTCNSMADGKLAVFPPKNKSGADVKLDGMDDILISEMTRSKCFQMIERDNDKMQVLFAEMDYKEGGKARRASRLEVAVRTLAAKAVKGEIASAERFFASELVWRV